MFKVGDKVVCINNGETIYGRFGIKPPTPMLEVGKIYTIRNNGIYDDILLKEFGCYFDKNRFVTLLECRKMKIEKIKYKINV